MRRTCVNTAQLYSLLFVYYYFGDQTFDKKYKNNTLYVLNKERTNILYLKNP